MNWTEEINTAVDILLDGGVILYPTDTIWGLGSDILHQEAVEKIYSLKKRERWQPLILLVSSIDMLKSYAINIHPRLENLLNVHGQPLTVIYDQVMGIPSYLRAKNGSVGIRICTDPYCIQLIEALGRPITSTSANLSGQPFPKYFGEVQSDILQQVDFICTYRRDSREERSPSVMVRCDPNGELDFTRV